ncbi:coiled-coil domain-containing protein 33 [Rhinophrynus dorsalis]
MPAPAASAAAPPGPPRLRLDDKVLSLEFLLLDAQFNEPGQYQLVLRVENPLLDGSAEGITVSINHGDIIQSDQAESDIVEQGDLTDTINFQKDTYLFILPKGLCKNDKHHDVRLSIDVLKFHGNSLKGGKKVGQALFAIYPRTNQPRINLRAAPFQPLYNYQGVLALLRVGGDDLAMHCGRLAYNVCFREYQPPKVEDDPKLSTLRPATLRTGTSHPGTPRSGTYNLNTPRPPSPALTISKSINSQPGSPRFEHIEPDTSKSDRKPASHTPGMHLDVSEPKDIQHFPSTMEQARLPSPESVSVQDQDDDSDHSDDTLPPTPLIPRPRRMPDNTPLRLPSPPKPPALKQKTHVTERPPAEGVPVPGAGRESMFLSPLETETIVVTLHSASDLPSTTTGSVPSPFVCLTRSSDERKGAGTQCISHAVKNPTLNPAWGETLTMTVRETEIEEEELILTVADSPTLEVLLTYRLPLSVLQPFHTYHLCMVQPHSQSPGSCRFYASVERRSSHITQQREFTYSALQVLLVGMETALQGPSHPLLAVARIVSNYSDYSESNKLHGLENGVCPVTVTFPDPAPTCFQIPSRATQGHPQISAPGLPPSQPVWNALYLFQGRDGVTLFSEGAALVLEYYPVTAEARRIPWNLSDCCGFSVVPLDMKVYHQLMMGSYSTAHTLHGVTIQGTDLKDVSGEPPTVSLQLLLLRSERPEFFLRPLEGQPAGQPESNRSLHHIQVPVTQTHQREEALGLLLMYTLAELPILQRDGPFLPPYNALANILPDPWTHSAQGEQKTMDPGGIPRQPHTNAYQQNPSNIVVLPGDPVMEHQEQEISNYRLAMQRMADDIIALRHQIGGLEAENSALRSERSLHQDLGRSLLSDTDIDVMTKAEIADRLATVKHKLASETSELRSMRDRVQQLQNELVRRNDREKELLLMQRAHQQQQAVLQQYHQRLSRARTLQDTIHKQEKVIEKMEKLLDHKLKDEKKIRLDGGERGGRVEVLQGDVHAALMAENSRLREELERLRFPTITLQQSTMEAFSDSEKFSLISKLEKSQARVQSLEQELEEAARRWGREKQQFMTQLSEREMGFSRTRTTILHHFPVKEPDPPTRRHAKLDPLL